MTADGARALALAAAGLFAMAVVGAAPGSPYQPLLTLHGQPHGPLTDLAVRIGLSRIPGNPILAVGVAASILAVGGFLLLLRAAFHGRIGVAPVAALGGGGARAVARSSVAVLARCLFLCLLRADRGRLRRQSVRADPVGPSDRRAVEVRGPDLGQHPRGLSGRCGPRFRVGSPPGCAHGPRRT